LALEKAKLLLDFDAFFVENFKQSGTKYTTSTKIQNLPPEQNQIVKLLSTSGDLSLPSIMQETKFDTDTIMQHITLLEINNYICQSISGIYGVC
jgi:hypothetical protein